MARHSIFAQPDLLAWPLIAAKKQEVQKCNDEKNNAIRAAFVARHGLKRQKQRELLEANNKLLKAELELEKLLIEANLK